MAIFVKGLGVGDNLYSTEATVEAIKRGIESDEEISARLNRYKYRVDLCAGDGALLGILPEGLSVDAFDLVPTGPLVKPQNIFDWKNSYKPEETAVILAPPPRRIRSFMQHIESQCDMVILVSTSALLGKDSILRVLFKKFDIHSTITLPDQPFYKVTPNGKKLHSKTRATCLVLFRRISGEPPRLVTKKDVTDFEFKSVSHIKDADICVVRKGQTGKLVTVGEVMIGRLLGHTLNIKIIKNHKFVMEFLESIVQSEWKKRAAAIRLVMAIFHKKTLLEPTLQQVEYDRSKRPKSKQTSLHSAE